MAPLLKHMEIDFLDIDCRRNRIQSFREDHPIAATVATAGLVTAGSLFLAPAIIVGGLNAVGFTASGIAGGRFLIIKISEKNLCYF